MSWELTWHNCADLVVQITMLKSVTPLFFTVMTRIEKVVPLHSIARNTFSLAIGYRKSANLTHLL